MITTFRRTVGIGLALGMMLLLAACSSGTATASPTLAASLPATSAAPPSEAASPSSAGGGTTGNAVAIQEFSFNPNALTVAKGTEVTWTNNGTVIHTVTFDTGGVDSGSIAPAGTFKRTFDAAGTFAYHCSIHPVMKGTITVTP